MNLIKRRNLSERNGERGSVLVMATIALSTVLVVIAGLAIDISHFYLVKTEMQDAADAAALAAASALQNTGTSTDIDDAVTRATSTANKYDIKNNVSISSNASIDCSDPNTPGICFAALLQGTYSNITAARANAAAMKFVRVRPHASSTTIFFIPSNVLGGPKSISATATAGLSVPSNTVCNFVPFSAAECDPGSSGCSLIVETPCVNPDPSCATTYTTKFCKGCNYTIKAAPGGSASPGNYLLLNLGSGGADLRFSLANSTPTCVSCITTQSGNVKGPVAQGLDTNFGIYNSPFQNNDASRFPPDANVIENVNHATYKAGLNPGTRNSSNFLAPSVGAQYADASAGPRVITIPIVPLSAYSNSCLPLNQIKWGQFFLRKSVDANGTSATYGDVVSEFLGYTNTPGGGGFDPGAGSGTTTTTRVTIVLYK